MVEQIKKYLDQPADKRDYDEGLILFSRNSKNRILIQRLSRKPWPEKLYYELRKIVDRFEPKPEPKQKKKTSKKDGKKGRKKSKGKKNTIKKEAGPGNETPFQDLGKVRVIAGDRKINLDELPEELQEKWKQNAAMYKEARSLHEKLKILTDSKASDEKRKPILDRLTSMNDVIRENWAAIDAWDPDQEPEVKREEKPEIDFKVINANKAYISRNLSKAEKDPENKTIQKNLQERIDQLVEAGHSFSEDQKERIKAIGLNLG